MSCPVRGGDGMERNQGRGEKRGAGRNIGHWGQWDGVGKGPPRFDTAAQTNQSQASNRGTKTQSGSGFGVGSGFTTPLRECSDVSTTLLLACCRCLWPPCNPIAGPPGRPLCRQPTPDMKTVAALTRERGKGDLCCSHPLASDQV